MVIFTTHHPPLAELGTVDCGLWRPDVKVTDVNLIVIALI